MGIGWLSCRQDIFLEHKELIKWMCWLFKSLTYEERPAHNKDYFIEKMINKEKQIGKEFD